MNPIEKAWICTVCGYIHYGDEPPETCPVCGATKDLFELKTDSVETQRKESASNRWRCLNCEYIHPGKSAPGICPVCGVSQESFEAYEGHEGKSEAGIDKKIQILIAGGGIAGVSAAEAIRKSHKEATIIIISKEEILPYYRLNLTRYLAGEIDEGPLTFHDEKWYRDNRIEIRRNSELCSIDPDGKTIQLKGGDTLSFDKLIITMGSHPFIPPIPGSNKENITALRTKADADFIMERSDPPVPIVIIGGGLLGLETAGAMAKRGCHVTLIEGFGWLLPRQLNETAGRMLEEYVVKSGIKLITKGQVKEFAGDDCVRSIVLEDGRSLNAEIAIISTGVRPNSYVARMAGLEVNQGIVVNNYLESSIPHIYAAGDVAEHHGMTYGTWGPSMFQGTISGMNASGGLNEFAGIPRSNLLKVLGYDMFSIGQIRGDDASFTTLEYGDQNEYYCFCFHDSHMVGAILMGNTDLSASVKTLIEKKEDCSGLQKESKSIQLVKTWIEGHQ
ncbi:MAG: FAD-dependent oxidoreductase [Spirochaetaceae bacterium]|nr:FAD-dependent oxidoreductase [Spirochaetaceae bacterium]